MFKAMKDNKIIAIANKKVGYMIVDDVKQEVELTPESYFPCLNYDEIVEDTEHTEDDYDQYNGEYLLKSEIPFDKEGRIAELKAILNSTDYKIIKCSECSLAGVELPYDVVELHAARQALRDEINELEGE